MASLFRELFVAYPIHSDAMHRCDHTRRRVKANLLDDGIGDTLVSVGAMTWRGLAAPSVISTITLSFPDNILKRAFFVLRLIVAAGLWMMSMAKSAAGAFAAATS